MSAHIYRPTSAEHYRQVEVPLFLEGYDALIPYANPLHECCLCRFFGVEGEDDICVLCSQLEEE